MAKTITGIVTSDISNKTIVVTVLTPKTHPIYKKKYSYSRKFMAHDESNSAKIGDKVVISECKPISARKHFNLDSIIEKAGITHNEPEITKESIQATDMPIKGKK